MDFDPQHPKWLCCCCHLTNGLMILAGSEFVVSVSVLSYSITHIVMMICDGQGSDASWFMITLIPMSVMYAITSALLIYGIHTYKDSFMYATIAARAIIIIFVQAFGVSTVVRPHSSIVVADGEIRKKWKASDDQQLDNFVDDRDEPSVALRLVLLTFAMIFISIFVFYTIYLIVRCIHYVKAYRRLMARRHSVIIACQIDPETPNNRKNSRISRRSLPSIK